MDEIWKKDYPKTLAHGMAGTPPPQVEDKKSGINRLNCKNHILANKGSIVP